MEFAAISDLHQPATLNLLILGLGLEIENPLPRGFDLTGKDQISNANVGAVIRPQIVSL